MSKNHDRLVSPLDIGQRAGGDVDGALRDAMSSGEELRERGDEEVDEETRKPNIAKRPYTPTRAEVEAHLPLHLEYRSWCPHCRAGKGVSMQHRKNVGEDSSELGITVSLDYCFMTAEEAE